MAQICAAEILTVKLEIKEETEETMSPFLARQLLPR